MISQGSQKKNKGNTHKFHLDFTHLPEIAGSALLYHVGIVYFEEKQLVQLKQSIHSISYSAGICKILVSNSLALQEIRYYKTELTELFSNTIGVSPDDITVVIRLSKG